MLDENTKQREIAGLTEAMKDYGLDNGFVLTEDEEYDMETDGFKITVKPVCKWLLEK